jgi:hypothetical protein
MVVGLLMVVVQGLAYGLYDGVADLVKQPIRGYKQHVRLYIKWFMSDTYG